MSIVFTDGARDASSNKLLFQVPEDVIGSGLVVTELVKAY
jgi:hypothetical protein